MEILHRYYCWYEFYYVPSALCVKNVYSLNLAKGIKERERMSKNRIGQNSMETIWQKSRWREAVDKLKNSSFTNFSLKNGYPTQPPSYREYDSPSLPHQREDDSQLLNTNKRMKDVSCCLKATNYIIGIFLLISLILSTVGTTTSYWLDTGTLNVGLFKVCTKSSTCDPVSSFTESAFATSKFHDTIHF